MTLLEQLERVEGRMEHALVKMRFDTFNQLASERLDLLRQLRFRSFDEAFFEQARLKTVSWVERIKESMEQARQKKARSKALSGYNSNPTRSGQVVNRSL